MTDHPAKHKSTDAAHKVAQVARDLEGGADNDLDLMVAGLLFGVSSIIVEPGLDRFLRLCRVVEGLSREFMGEYQSTEEAS